MPLTLVHGFALAHDVLQLDKDFLFGAPDFLGCYLLLENDEYSSSDFLENSFAGCLSAISGWASDLQYIIDEADSLKLQFGTKNFHHWVSVLKQHKIFSHPIHDYLDLGDSVDGNTIQSYYQLKYECMAGADVNQRTLPGIGTALHHLLVAGKDMQEHIFLAKLKVLCTHGADIYAVGYNGYTPAFVADAFGTLQLFESVLEDLGFDIEEVWERSYEIRSEWRRQNTEKKKLRRLTGGGVSTSVDTSELLPVTDGLASRQPRLCTEIDE